MTDLRTAEMIKYASNAFLATKISFINEIAVICEKLGADVEEVARAWASTSASAPRSSTRGWATAAVASPRMSRRWSTWRWCMGRTRRCCARSSRSTVTCAAGRSTTCARLLGGQLDGKRIGLLGLAFKPNTDDIREAPALEIARMLQNEGALVSGYDPVAMANAARVNPQLHLVEDPYDLAENVDALMVCTEWNEFKQLDLNRLRNLMARPVVVDGRNIYDPKHMREIGFVYKAVGRGQAEPNGQ
jgi:UDPglucose 6-dehydrogenase